MFLSPHAMSGMLQDLQQRIAALEAHCGVGRGSQRPPVEPEPETSPEGLTETPDGRSEVDPPPPPPPSD